MVAQVCSPSYFGGRDRRIAVQGQKGQNYMENKLKAKGERGGSSGRAFTSQVESPVSYSLYPQKKCADFEKV
jgi:hypothetical protein